MQLASNAPWNMSESGSTDHRSRRELKSRSNSPCLNFSNEWLWVRRSVCIRLLRRGCRVGECGAHARRQLTRDVVGLLSWSSHDLQLSSSSSLNTLFRSSSLSQNSDLLDSFRAA